MQWSTYEMPWLKIRLDVQLLKKKRCNEVVSAEYKAHDLLLYIYGEMKKLIYSI